MKSILSELGRLDQQSSARKKSAQDALSSREAMLKSLNRAALALLTRGETGFGEAMTEGVGLIAEIAGIERVTVYRNTRKPDGLYTTQVFRWLTTCGAAISTKPELAEISFDRDLPRWRAMLEGGEYINGAVKYMPEAPLLKRLGCMSLLTVPVFNDDEFWGGVLFENLSQERVFTPDEAEVLHSAGLMLANVIHRSEKAKLLRAADEYAKLMIEAMPLSCVIWDANHHAMDCNEVAVRHYGFANKAECLANLDKTYPEYQPDGVHSATLAQGMMQKAFRDGSCTYEWQNCTKDGTPIPTQITLTCIRNGDDELVVGYAQDLREHKRMMDEIKWRNQLLKAVNRVSSTMLASTSDTFDADMLHSLSIMAQAVQADRAYLWKNSVFEGRLRCSQVFEWCEGANSQQGKDITIDTDYDDVAPEWKDTLSRGLCVNGIVRSLSKNEQAALIPQGVLSVLAVPVFLKGEFWGFIGFDDCHKERRFSKSEEAILLSASRLVAEALVRHDMEETLRASAEALQRALVEAQSACLAKSEFLSTMSHEMRTPLNAVIGMTAIGKRACDARRKDYALDRIEEASTHLLTVINDILDMSKIEAGKLELSPVEFNVEHMLQKVITVVGHRAGEKQQEFTTSVGADVPRFVVGDDQRLAQIITNLLANAIKFTPEKGKIHLGVSCAGETDGSAHLLFEIADSGIGISADQQARLFQSFGQAESGISREFGGTGLGLAISKRLVEMMDGRIWVESEPGNGARFIFTVTVPVGTKDLRSMLSPDVRWDDVRVLVAKGNDSERGHIEDFLDVIGVKRVVAQSGHEACRAIESGGGFDVCFIDLHTPGMDGHELTRRIKTLSINTQVVLISSTSWENLQEAMHDSGADRCLVKPILSLALMECLNECLRPSIPIAAADETGEFAGKTLLLAEDMDINREIVLSLLDGTGLTIDCAENGMEAFSMMKHDPKRYDIVFMDVQMPFMDGLEATRRIRALPAPWCKKIPIIAMTANVFKDDISNCLTSGMNGHIGKPIDYEAMMGHLRSVIGR